MEGVEQKDISPQISSNLVKKCRFSREPPQISSNSKNRKFHFGNFTVWQQELELRVHDLWITNQFFDPTNQKLVKLLFFTNCFSQNRVTLNNQNRRYLPLYLSRVKGVRLNERTKFSKLSRKRLWNSGLVSSRASLI